MKSHFGLFIKQSRQAAGHTVESLAYAIGCDKVLIESVERNLRRPPGNMMIAWCNEIRFPFEQMAYLFAKEQIRMMYLEAGLQWDPQSDTLPVASQNLDRQYFPTERR